MTDFRRLYCAGITSVLRRCFVVGAVAVWLPSVGAANMAETSSVEAAISLVERFEEVCAPQVERGEIPDKSNLIALDAEQIASMSRALGYKEPDAIWSDAQAAWYQIQHSFEKPETCQLVSFHVSYEDLLTAWKGELQSNERWQSFSDMEVEHVNFHDGGGATSYFAFRRYEDRVILAGIAGVQLIETGYVMLRYQKTNVRAAGGETKEDR